MLGNYKITFFSLFSYLHTSKGRAGDKCQGWDNLGDYLAVRLTHIFYHGATVCQPLTSAW